MPERSAQRQRPVPQAPDPHTLPYFLGYQSTELGIQPTLIYTDISYLQSGSLCSLILPHQARPWVIAFVFNGKVTNARGKHCTIFPNFQWKIHESCGHGCQTTPVSTDLDPRTQRCCDWASCTTAVPLQTEPVFRRHPWNCFFNDNFNNRKLRWGVLVVILQSSQWICVVESASPTITSSLLSIHLHSTT